MNQRLLALVVSAAVVLGGGFALAQASSDTRSERGANGPVQPGQQSTTMEKGTATSPEHLRTLRITVKDTDPKSNKVTFEAQVTPEANVEKNGQPIRINELRKGDEVRASFDPRTGELVKLQVLKSGDQDASQKGDVQKTR